MGLTMPNLIKNRLYVKNTGPEFNLLRSIVTKEAYPFSKLYPMPETLERESENLNRLFEKASAIQLRRDYWRPKVNKVIEKLNSYGLSLSPLRDLDYVDFEKVMTDGLGKRNGTLRQRIRMWFKKRREEGNIKKYGAKDWLEWRVMNWGTKWDAYDLNVIYSGEDEFCIQFSTANNPPCAIYNQLGVDFPSCAMMVFAWSIEADFISCASKNPRQAWSEENLGKVLTEKQQLLDALPKPSQYFYEFARQFKTPVPDWFEEIPKVPDVTSKLEVGI